jgi:dTDP-4-amino-4,6-dideoxygalactose transaminase
MSDTTRTDIKFGDLSREYQDLQTDVDAALSGVLRRGWFVLGPAGEQFEKAFAAYLGVPRCVGVASGTEALALALMACGVGVGDEVITVAHTAVPTISAISMVGAVPRFVDIHPDTGLMDVGGVAAAISARTKAIMPVHLYGQCVDMEALAAVAEASHLPIIEDCAQAHGATCRGRVAGTMGRLGCFSFYPSKNLGCYGDGGAVVTHDPALAEQLVMLRNYGQRKRYHHDIIGINSRLDEMQAAILSAKLPHLDAWNRRRQVLARLYDEGLRGLPLGLPVTGTGNGHVYHLYVVQTGRRAELQEFLTRRGVQTLVHYPIPAHRQAAYQHLGYHAGALPVTERLAGEVLSLPLYPQLRDDEAQTVARCIREFYA